MACNLKSDPEVEKAFWNEAKGLLGKGVEPEEVIKQIAAKHKLGTDAVGAVLQSKQLFQLTNEAWAKQAKLADLRSAAKREANRADMHPVVKKLAQAYEYPRNLLTKGHGGVIPFTHARSSFFIYGENRIFRQAVADAYSYMAPNKGSARWRADMATLRSDPKFNFWSRVGLDIKLQSSPVGMGMTRWTRQSFDALKTMRLKLAKKYWEQLDPADRTFEKAQDLAKRLNHATGVVKTPPVVSKIAGATMFSPKLRFAKYASALSDPFQSGFAAKRFAKLAAVQLGILAINDMVNRHILGNNDKVNWTDPTRADWMRAKVAGMTIPMAPMFETAKLPVSLAANLLDPREHDKIRIAVKEIASAVHPSISAAYGLATGKDFSTGKTLPFKGLSQHIYGDYRDKKKEQIGKGEYASGYAPIPAQPVLKEMAKEGIPPDLSEKFLKAYAETLLSGGAGTHTYPNVDYKPKKFPKQTGE